MQNAKCKVQNAKCKVQSAKYKIQNAKYEMQGTKCKNAKEKNPMGLTAVPLYLNDKPWNIFSSLLHLGRIAKVIMLRCSYTERLSLVFFSSSISRSIAIKGM